MKRLLITAALVMASLSAECEVFSFNAITENDPSGYAQSIGESQLFMDVTLLGLGQASFVFANTGPANASVSQIYFDYLPSLDISLDAINDGNGVDFVSSPVRPENLPGGKSLPIPFIAEWGVAARNPHQGINPNENLELIIQYDASYDLLGSLGNQNLRVGMHVQSIGCGEYSESFVNTIPEPASMGMLCAGSIFSIILRNKNRRRNRKNSKQGFESLNEECDLDFFQNSKLAYVYAGRKRLKPPIF
jgi:hypothetical protein